MNAFWASITDKILSGGMISESEAYSLLDASGNEQLYDAAAKVTAALCPKEFDSCSIINVRSGRCPENCRWCAQSAHYSTGCEEHGVTPREECIEAARANHQAGIRRFSLVASGRAVRGKDLDEMCGIVRGIQSEVGIYTCASMGLLDKDGLQKLWDSGVRRYHCNLETAPSHFPELCTTHTIDDKIATIECARQVGMEICSGGIIGMGETARQRVEFALTLRKIDPVSIPINILCPIPGTPLEKAKPLSDTEILDTIAIFRLIHPSRQLRFAGGRTRLTRDLQLKALRIGINGGIVGDLLTTIGSKVAQDRKLVTEAGYKFQ